MAVSGLNLSTSGTGLGSGIDVQSTVNQLITAESGPLQQAQTQSATLSQEQSTISSLGSILSSMKTNADKLKDVGGAFDSVVSSSSNPSLLSVTADRTATPGKHQISVGTLASAASYYTAEQTSATASLGAGSFQLQLGSQTPVTVSFTSGQDTLTDIARSINALAIGVHATVITDSRGARLSVSGDATGSASDVTISSDTAGLGWVKASDGADATLTVDGVPLVSASNTVSGVLQGVTLQLNSAAPGASVQVDIEPDEQAATTAIQSFVNTYNSLMKSVNAQFTFDTSTKSAGILSGDPYLRELQQRLLSEVAMDTGSGQYTSLRSMGVQLQNDGTLQVDASTLSQALSSNFSAVRSAFQGSGGLGQSISSDLLDLNDPVTGLMNADLKSVADQQSTTTDRIQTLNDYLTTQRKMLTDKYTQINVLMQEQTAQIAQVQAELGVKNQQ